MTPKNNQRLTFEEHERLGIYLQKVHDELLTIAVRLGNRYSRRSASTTFRLAESAYKKIAALRVALEGQLNKDCPETIYSNSHVYFRGATPMAEMNIPISEKPQVQDYAI